MFNHPAISHRRAVKAAFWLSVLAALILAGASAAGLLLPDQAYADEALVQAFLVNDVVNLVIGLPMLLGSLWAAARNRLLGLLFWPGALFFIIYNYIVYVFAMPLNWAFLLHLVLLTISIYALILLLAAIHPDVVQQKLAGRVREKLCGGALMFLGVLMTLQVLGALAGEMNHPDIERTALALHTSDMILAPAAFLGGLLLWRRQPVGYVISLGLLFQLSMLFIGLEVLFILEPWMLRTPFRAVDFIVILVMGIPAFLPGFLYIRGVLAAEKNAGGETH